MSGTVSMSQLSMDTEMGAKADWVANVLGQEVFGSKLEGFVSMVDGVSKAVVRLPAIPEGVGPMGLAGFFRAASGTALRHAYTTLDKPVASSENSVSVVLSASEVADSECVVPTGVSEVAAGAAFPGTDAACGLLNSMNEAALSRAGVLGGSRMASGRCYGELFRQSCRDEVSVSLGRWPSLRSVLNVPRDKFASGEILQRVGVSVRAGALHFQSGWGDGVLTALDVIAVGARAGSGSVDGLNELLDMRVGGFSSEKEEEDYIERLEASGQSFDPGDRVMCDLEGYVAGRSGFCYLEFFREDCRVAVAEHCGPFPEWRLVFSLPTEWFLTCSELDKVGVWNEGKFVLHIGKESPGWSVVYYLGSASEVISRYCAMEGLPLRGLTRAYEGTLGPEVDGGTLRDPGSREPVMPLCLHRIGGTVMGDWLKSVGVSCLASDEALISSSPALLQPAGKNRHRMLEAVGDSVITMMLATEVAASGGTAEEYQNRRSLLTSNARIAALFVKEVPKGAVAFASGVSPTGNVGARAFEVVVGSVYLQGGLGPTRKLLDHVGFFNAV